MRVLAAVDKFKGTATAAQVASAIGHACWELGHDCVELPVADGGEGTLEALGGPNRTSVVTGPLGDPVTAEQMESLFGKGEHPLAAQRLAALGPDATEQEPRDAVRLGRPFRMPDTSAQPFHTQLLRRYGDWNQQHGNRRSAKLGTARIRQELQGKGLDPQAVTDAVASLKATELVRAREVWRKKFGAKSDGVATDAAERGKQKRFLAARGFGGDVIRGFSFAIFLGVLLGTYSSVYVAKNLGLFIGLDRSEKPKGSDKNEFANVDA